jgi:hypothetical protein
MHEELKSSFGFQDFDARNEGWTLVEGFWLKVDQTSGPSTATAAGDESVGECEASMDSIEIVDLDVNIKLAINFYDFVISIVNYSVQSGNFNIAKPLTKPSDSRQVPFRSLLNALLQRLAVDATWTLVGEGVSNNTCVLSSLAKEEIKESAVSKSSNFPWLQQLKSAYNGSFVKYTPHSYQDKLSNGVATAFRVQHMCAMPQFEHLSQEEMRCVDTVNSPMFYYCSKGHMMLPSTGCPAKYKRHGGSDGTASCDMCRARINYNVPFVHCADCSYDLCPKCMQENSRQNKVDNCYCLRGHILTRLTGRPDEYVGSATCDMCRAHIDYRLEFGHCATCGYDLCPVCVQYTANKTRGNDPANPTTTSSSAGSASNSLFRSSNASAPTSAGVNFGTGFGSGQPSRYGLFGSSAASSSLFGSASTTSQASSAIPFGQSGMSSSFGAVDQPSRPGLFGSSAASSSLFGSASTTSQAPAAILLGQSSAPSSFVASATPSLSFGASATPTFGASTASFGAAGPGAFGSLSAPASASAFGGATATPSLAPGISSTLTFGLPSASQTPAVASASFGGFGAPVGETGSVIAPGNPFASAFGLSSPAPAAAPVTAASFGGFGTNIAPGNPFTPAFGLSSTPAAAPVSATVGGLGSSSGGSGTNVVAGNPFAATLGLAAAGSTPAAFGSATTGFGSGASSVFGSTSTVPASQSSSLAPAWGTPGFGVTAAPGNPFGAVLATPVAAAAAGATSTGQPASVAVSPRNPFAAVVSSSLAATETSCARLTSADTPAAVSETLPVSNAPSAVENSLTGSAGSVTYLKLCQRVPNFTIPDEVTACAVLNILNDVAHCANIGAVEDNSPAFVDYVKASFCAMDIDGNGQLTEEDFIGLTVDCVVSPEKLYKDDNIQSMSRQVRWYCIP